MSRADYNDRLADYVEVKERIKLFYEAHPEGRLTTTEVRITSEPDDVPRVWVEAAAYRTPDDPVPGRGWSWMVLPGSTPYTRGSELENTETSAWGRAIGALGIGIDKGIASAQEVRAKAGEDTRVIAPQTRTDDGGLIGTAEIGKGQSDFELRQSPEGNTIGFRLTQGRSGIKVVANDPIATALSYIKDDVLGKRVICWGSIADETFTANKGKPNERKVTYQVLTLSKIQTPEVTLPADEPDDGPPAEAESVPLFDDVEQAKIDAAVDKATAA